MEINQELFDKFMGEIYDVAFTVVDCRTDYSGRGMYGKECIGLVSDNVVKLAMAVAVVLSQFETEYDESDDENPYPCWYDLDVRTDNMGFDTIMYFPNWQLSQ